MLHRPVEAANKARVSTKDNQQNKLDDSSLDFNNSLNNGNSNTYDQTARTSGNIKALKEDHKKVLCRAETPVESPSTAGNINTSGYDTTLHILDSGDEELVNILQSFKTEKAPKNVIKGD